METPAAMDGARVSSHWNSQCNMAHTQQFGSQKREKKEEERKKRGKRSCPIIDLYNLYLIEASLSSRRKLHGGCNAWEH